MTFHDGSPIPKLGPLFINPAWDPRSPSPSMGPLFPTAPQKVKHTGKEVFSGRDLGPLRGGRGRAGSAGVGGCAWRPAGAAGLCGGAIRSWPSNVRGLGHAWPCCPQPCSHHHRRLRGSGGRPCAALAKASLTALGVGMWAIAAGLLAFGWGVAGLGAIGL